MTGLRKDRLWLLLGLVTAVAVAAASFLLAIGPQLEAKAAAETELADVQVQNVTLQRRINELRAANRHLGDLRAELAAAEAALPPRHDLDAFTEQLTAQASAAGVVVVAITPGTPVALPTSSAAPAPATEPEEETSAEEDVIDDETGTAASPPTDDGPAGRLFSLPVTVVTEGAIGAQRDFTRAVQQDGPRTALVIGTALEPLSEGAADADRAWWTMTTQLTVFVAPQADTGEDPGPPATR